MNKREDFGQPLKKHPFVQLNYDHRVDHSYAVVLNNLKRQEKNFVGILQNVPAVIRENMESVMHVPDMAPTRQVIWALAISRFPALDFVLSQAHRTPQTKNQSEVHRVNRTFILWKNMRVFEGVMPPDMQADVIREMQAIQAKANP
jgi:hypothetical protein